MTVNPFALTDGVPEARVAQRLVEARRRAGFTRYKAARQTGVARSNLLRIEKGRMRPPDGTLIALCRSYGVTVHWLVPERSGNLVRVTPESIEVAGRSRTLGGEDPDVDVVLRSYLSLVRELRGIATGAVVNLRDEDLAALAQALGDSPSEIEARLVDLMMLSRDEARTIRRELVKRRVGAPAAGLLLASAVFTSTLDSGSGRDASSTNAASHESPASAIVTPSAMSLERVAETPAVDQSVAVAVEGTTLAASDPLIEPTIDAPSPAIVLIGDAFAIERPAEENVVDDVPSFVPLPDVAVPDVDEVVDEVPAPQDPQAPVVDVPPVDVPVDVVVPPVDVDVPVDPPVEPGDDVPANENAGDVPANENAGDVPANENAGDVPADDDTGDVPANEHAGDVPANENAGDVPADDDTEGDVVPEELPPVEEPEEVDEELEPEDELEEEDETEAGGSGKTKKAKKPKKNP